VKKVRHFLNLVGDFPSTSMVYQKPSYNNDESFAEEPASPEYSIDQVVCTVLTPNRNSVGSEKGSWKMRLSPNVPHFIRSGFFPSQTFFILLKALRFAYKIEDKCSWR
jgi:hypothetical protein